jgi:hypothetical protein
MEGLKARIVHSWDIGKAPSAAQIIGNLGIVKRKGIKRKA